jgi:hypothetical protein
MGLDTSSIVFLCAAKSIGVDFGSTAMVGRQSFWPDEAALRRVFSVLGIDRDAADFLRQHEYGEEFFSLLGAHQIDSVDVSPYEKATILHDMNLPLPIELRERFTLVFDGGSIEHVFNIPQAFKNCMDMVRVGGHFTQVNVANNFAGHGFWQFSPELIFRIFSEQNGFRLEAVLMHEVTPGGSWYLVSDPDDVRQRVQLCNDQPTYILTIARRLDRSPIFATTPQQSDYVSLWDRTLNPTSLDATSQAHEAGWRRYIPPSVKPLLKSLIGRVYHRPRVGCWPSLTPGFSSKGYRLISEDDLLRGKLPRRGL